MADIDPQLEDKLVDHLKKLWADNISLHAKVEGFSLGAEGPIGIFTHRQYKKVAKHIMRSNHKIGHTIRYLDETPPASIERIQELTEIKDATEVPNVEDINSQLVKDFNTVRDRAVKAHKRAHDVEQFGIASIITNYIQLLDHWIWHAKAVGEEDNDEKI